MSDVHWPNVTLLALHENGADAAVVFIDASNSSHVLTAQANAQWDTAQKPVGLTSSLLLDGTGDRITIPAHVDFGFGTGDYAVEAWLFTNPGVAGTVIDFRNGTSNDGALVIYTGGGPSPEGFHAYYGDTQLVAGNNALGVGEWHHSAVARFESETRVFVDGVQYGVMAPDTRDYGASKPCVLGAAFWNGGHISGWLAAVRITKGSARGYTTNFTPPTLPYDMAPGVNVRAIVVLLATAGAGGTGLQRLVYAVTFFGDDVPPMAELAGQKQVEIEVALPNSFTNETLRAAIVAAVQAKAIELGLAIEAVDVLPLSGAST